jgi:hypothetical protein
MQSNVGNRQPLCGRLCTIVVHNMSVTSDAGRGSAAWGPHSNDKQINQHSGYVWNHFGTASVERAPVAMEQELVQVNVSLNGIITLRAYTGCAAYLCRICADMLPLYGCNDVTCGPDEPAFTLVHGSIALY